MRLSVLTAATLTLCAAQPASTANRAAPDLALSAASAPARYVVRDSAHRARLEAYLRGTQGRTGAAAPYAVKGNTFTLSRRWVARLAAEEGDTPGDDERGRRGRARLRLERESGGPVEEAGMGFAAGYLPAEASFVYAATEQEEDKPHCRQKPMWPYLERASLCGDTTRAHINMAPVWERFDGADTLVIAVLDAGFDFLHPELQGRWAVNEAEANGLPGVDDDGNGFVDDVRGWDFVDDDADAQDYHGHGTMTSGVIAAGFDDGAGFPGMLPRVKILPVRVLSTAGFGNSADIAAGIRYAVARGAHAINFSIGITSSSTDPTLRGAFLAARDAGVPVSAASGNNALDVDATPRQPFSYGFANVYGVVAHDPHGNLAGFSNYGATRIDIAAPGDHIVTTGIPPARALHEESFENFTGAGWTFTGSWAAETDSAGGKSLQWMSGGIATASLNAVDLRGKRGGLLTFRLSLRPASSNDGLDVYVVTETDTVAVNASTGTVNNRVIAVNLGPVDDAAFKLVFRACVVNVSGNCSASASTTNRVLRIDDVRITHADLDPSRHGVITVTGGTSLASPFFAGYAGLMRLAAARAGVPLTRERMLAGVRPEPALAGKVATGGRLDVAKGLAFYLDTLPRIVVADSLHTAWPAAASVAYALTVRDSAGPREGYTFTPIALPAGGALTPSGLFAWNSGASEGSFAVRAKAGDGTHVLRSLTTFTVGTVTPVRPAAPDRASRLRVAGRVFLLPPAAFARAETWTLRVEVYAADGRTLRAIEGPLTLPAGARMMEYELHGVRGAGARAWLNGVPLMPARD